MKIIMDFTYNLENCVILDTETTGIGEDDQIIEIGVIDAQTGKILLDTLVKPTISIPPRASEIHGMFDADVADAPVWSEVKPLFLEAIEGKTLLIYNKEFDIRMIAQTNGGGRDALAKKSFCVMRDYAEYYGDWNEYRGNFRWHKLTEAAAQMKIYYSDLTAHRAVSDCEITRRLIHAYFPIYKEIIKAAAKREKARVVSANSHAKLKAKIFNELVPKGARLIGLEYKDRSVVDDKGNVYPYFKWSARPKGSITISKVTLSNIDKYQYAGMCVSSYGTEGHLVVPKSEEEQ